MTSAMHGFMAVKSIHRYLRYRQTLNTHCPHCHQELGFVTAVTAGIALPPCPEGETPAATKPGFEANMAGEDEGDMLIMKS
jgi:hypothetical protein